MEKLRNFFISLLLVIGAALIIGSILTLLFKIHTIVGLIGCGFILIAFAICIADYHNSKNF
jgi:hypothetical protein